MMMSDESKGNLKEVFKILKENVKYLNDIYLQASEDEKEFISCRIFSYRQTITSFKEVIKKHDIKEDEIGLDQLDLNTGLHI